jgi:HSP20 family protein
MEEEMRDLVSRFLGNRQEAVWPAGGLGSLDVSETDGQVEIRLDLPGVEAKEIDIQLNENLLTISGERKEEKEEKNKTYHRVERRYGSFSRSISLPCPVKQEAIDAQYRDGVLTIKLPKSEEARARKIKVKT